MDRWFGSANIRIRLICDLSFRLDLEMPIT